MPPGNTCPATIEGVAVCGGGAGEATTVTCTSSVMRVPLAFAKTEKVSVPVSLGATNESVLPTTTLLRTGVPFCCAQNTSDAPVTCAVSVTEAPVWTVRFVPASTDGAPETSPFVEVTRRPACPLNAVVASKFTPSIAYAPAKGSDVPEDDPKSPLRRFNCRWICAMPAFSAWPSGATVPRRCPTTTESPRFRPGSANTWHIRRFTSELRTETQVSEV